MYSSNHGVKSNVDIDNNNTQTRQSNTSPPVTSNRSESSSPSCPTLLVIDDTTNSDEETINNNNYNNNKNNIPIKLMPPINAQISHMQMPSNLTPSTHLDILNDTPDQQRRRNSSIAKLLGGHPLHNQQYEEINQQIIDDQTAQNLPNNNDNGNDNGMQRTRSSITRTLLMNNERTNSLTKLAGKPPIPSPLASSSSSFSRDFDYLIRQEVDKPENEHGPSTLQRTNSAPKMVQNLNPSISLALQAKLKRKRTISKSSLPTSNIPPFALNDPFQLDTSKTNSNSSTVTQSPNLFPHHDSSKRPRHLNPQQYPLPTHQTLYSHPKTNLNSLFYNQLSSSQDRTSLSNCSLTCNCPHYSHSTNLTLPSPVTHLSSSSTTIQNTNPNSPTTSSSKSKSMLNGSDVLEATRPRSYSNLSNQSDSSETSSKTTIPLKKRLLDAYNNEQYPNSSL